MFVFFSLTGISQSDGTFLLIGDTLLRHSVVVLEDESLSSSGVPREVLSWNPKVSQLGQTNLSTLQILKYN